MWPDYQDCDFVKSKVRSGTFEGINQEFWKWAHHRLLKTLKCFKMSVTWLGRVLHIRGKAWTGKFLRLRVLAQWCLNRFVFRYWSWRNCMRYGWAMCIVLQPFCLDFTNITAPSPSPQLINADCFMPVFFLIQMAGLLQELRNRNGVELVCPRARPILELNPT